MKRWLSILLVLGMLLCVAGCRTEKPNTEDEGKNKWEPEAPKVFDLTALLTKEDVTQALGVAVGDGLLQEHDTVWLFSSEDYLSQVWLMLEEELSDPVAYLEEAIKPRYPNGLRDAPNLGEASAAYWSADSGELWVAYKDYVFNIGVVAAQKDAEACLVVARDLARTIMDRL